MQTYIITYFHRFVSTHISCARTHTHTETMSPNVASPPVFANLASPRSETDGHLRELRVSGRGLRVQGSGSATSGLQGLQS